MPHPQSTLERGDTTLHGPQRPIHGTVTAHMTSAARGGHTQTRHATRERPIERLSAARAPHTRLGRLGPTRVRPDSIRPLITSGSHSAAAPRLTRAGSAEGSRGRVARRQEPARSYDHRRWPTNAVRLQDAPHGSTLRREGAASRQLAGRMRVRGRDASPGRRRGRGCRRR